MLLDTLRGRSTHAEAWGEVGINNSRFSLLDRRPPHGVGSGRLTRSFAGQVTAEQEAKLVQLMPEDRRRRWEALDDESRMFLLVPLALAYDVPGVEETTGLSRVMPPQDVHAMTHDLEAAGGSLYYGDLVVESLAAVGAPFEAGTRVLDFGCSSGRVSRVLKAYEPAAECDGCDPNGPAVEWAAENLPGIRFFESPLAPPLDVVEGTYDVAFAISIWSHFDEGPALAWLEEMRRILRPGGYLIVTTQGFSAVRGFVANDPSLQTRDFAIDALGRMYVSGFHFLEVFEDDDWGVPAEGWGMAVMSPEWLLERTTPGWRTSLFRPGAVEWSQDLYVLEKV